MDEQTKRTMLKVRVSDDFIIFRTVSRQKKSPRLYVQRDELSPLYEGKRVVLNDGPYFCVVIPLNRDGMMRMEFPRALPAFPAGSRRSRFRGSASCTFWKIARRSMGRRNGAPSRTTRPIIRA